MTTASPQLPPAMTPQQERLTDSKSSAVGLYRDLAVGNAPLPHWLWYEACTLFASGLPGIIGLGARSVLYPTLFEKCGRRPAIGRGVLLRAPKQIRLGNQVLVDDYAALDVREAGSSIEIADRVSIGRFSTIAAKGGRIELHSGVNIGSYCRVATNSKIVIGESVLIGAYSYIGPGNHTEQEGVPLISSPMEIRGGVTIGAHAWIGAGVTILDGVTIGTNAIIGAQSLVTSDVPERGVAVGSPARVVKVRE